MSRTSSIVLLTTLLLLVGGCASMKPGNLEAVSFQSEPEAFERAGNVYLLRGWIGIFSTGINDLTDKLNESGVRAHVYQDDQWRALARKLAEEAAASPEDVREPLVLVGHSYGADDVIRIARRLEEHGVVIDLLVTLDPVTPPEVPGNVRACLNLYQAGLLDVLPILRGVPVDGSQAGEMANVNIREDRRDLLEPGTNHFNIEKSERVHAEIVATVLRACPPRQTWALKRHESREILAVGVVEGQ